jgi:hypothetical protein
VSNELKLLDGIPGETYSVQLLSISSAGLAAWNGSAMVLRATLDLTHWQAGLLPATEQLDGSDPALGTPVFLASLPGGLADGLYFALWMDGSSPTVGQPPFRIEEIAIAGGVVQSLATLAAGWASFLASLAIAGVGQLFTQGLVLNIVAGADYKAADDTALLIPVYSPVPHAEGDACSLAVALAGLNNATTTLLAATGTFVQVGSQWYAQFNLTAAQTSALSAAAVNGAFVWDLIETLADGTTSPVYTRSRCQVLPLLSRTITT